MRLRLCRRRGQPAPCGIPWVCNRVATTLHWQECKRQIDHRSSAVLEFGESAAVPVFRLCVVWWAMGRPAKRSPATVTQRRARLRKVHTSDPRQYQVQHLLVDSRPRIRIHQATSNHVEFALTPTAECMTAGFTCCVHCTLRTKQKGLLLPVLPGNISKPFCVSGVGLTLGGSFLPTHLICRPFALPLCTMSRWQDLLPIPHRAPASAPPHLAPPQRTSRLWLPTVLHTMLTARYPTFSLGRQSPDFHWHQWSAQPPAASLDI